MPLINNKNKPYDIGCPISRKMICKYNGLIDFQTFFTLFSETFPLWINFEILIFLSLQKSVLLL